MQSIYHVKMYKKYVLFYFVYYDDKLWDKKNKLKTSTHDRQWIMIYSEEISVLEYFHQRRNIIRLPLEIMNTGLIEYAQGDKHQRNSPYEYVFKR